MQQGFEKDYKFLLYNLIPREYLSGERKRGINKAIALDERVLMLKESYLAMEELSRKGLFRRRGPEKSGDRISIFYEGDRLRTGITLQMSLDEWRTIGGMADEKGRKIAPSPVLTGIISALSLNNTTAGTAHKLKSVLEMTSKVKAGSEGFLILGLHLNITGVHSGDGLAEENIDKLMKNPLYGAAVRKRKILVVSNPDKMKYSAFTAGRAAGAIIIIPLLSGDNRLGIMEIHYPEAEGLGRNKIFNYSLIARGIIRLLQNNIQLERMVSIDRLTKVNNRNYYENQVPLEIERASRDKKCLAFLMMDIDHFKRFNDRYGHDVGDEVLKLVARTIKSHLRKIDLFIRFGGEEFIALLPGADREAAMRTAERLRDVVENTPYRTGDGTALKVTVSVGGSIFPDDARNQSELFRHADDSLLKAKREGRNRIVFYGSD